MTFMVVLVLVLVIRRREYSVAQRGTDVGHDTFEQCVKGGSVVDDVGQPVVVQVDLDAPIDRPAGVDLSGELGT